MGPLEESERLFPCLGLKRSASTVILAATGGGAKVVALAESNIQDIEIVRTVEQRDREIANSAAFRKSLYDYDIERSVAASLARN